MKMVSDVIRQSYRAFSWKAVSFQMSQDNRPTSAREWLGWAWGQDIWMYGVPLVKLFVGANIAMWILLWVTR